MLNLPASTSGIWNVPAAGAGAVVAAGAAGAVVAAGATGALVAGAAAGAQAATNIDNTNITAINDQNFLDILLLLTEFEIRETEANGSETCSERRASFRRG
jgi:hypothetical protein